jgi:glycosyltransferase involved in cell wall biosynthesis
MRVLMLTQYFLPEKGAAQVRLWEIAKAWKQRGYEVTVVTAFPHYAQDQIPEHYNGKAWAHEEMEGITIYRTWVFPVRRGRLWLRLLNYFSFVVSARYGLNRCAEQDLIFVESPPLFLGFTAALAQRMKKAPLIFNIADLWPESAIELGLIRPSTLTELLADLARAFYRRSTKISVQTEGIRRALIAQGIPPTDIVFLPNGVDTDMFRPVAPDESFRDSLGVSPEQKIILYAGTMGYAHGLEVALAAANELRDREDILFLLIGDGTEKPRLEKLAGTMRLTNVRFLPYQPLAEVPRYYALASLALSTLRRYDLAEGVRPSKMFPALACGCPLIYVGTGEGAEITVESGGGVVLPPENPELLAATITELLADEERCRSMAEAGRQYVVEKYDWCGIMARWFDQLNQGGFTV